MHIRVKLLGGEADVDHFQFIGGNISPHPIGFRHPFVGLLCLYCIMHYYTPLIFQKHLHGTGLTQSACHWMQFNFLISHRSPFISVARLAGEGRG